MKNIIITGGAGFIGSSLAERLLSLGNKVIIIDNFNDYYDPKIKRRNISELYKFIEKEKLNLGSLKVYEGDIRDKKFINNVFSEKIDVLVHLAAMAGVRPSIEQPELYYDVNVMGTLNLLENCKCSGVSKVVFASSSSVYGNNKKVPFSETDIVDNPISPYAASKKAGELMCHNYYHLYNISIACLRFFTVYGPKQRPDLAIHKFSKLIMEDKEIPFFGDGSTKRDYTYIGDIINGIVKTINWLNSTDEKQYEVFNLGSKNPISLTEMIGTIEKSIGKKAKINKLPMQPGDVNVTYADISKAERALGYETEISFNEGISNFIKWSKSL